uniref:Uncharacterized protein n=1 Tax=Setaria italica TaxID=4555 RepID=K4A463_SETIT
MKWSKTCIEEVKLVSCVCLSAFTSMSSSWHNSRVIIHAKGVTSEVS